MKNTGVIRRIDELGRIVIPKEIRDVFNIDSYDSIEIYVDNDKIILKKYSKVEKNNEYINGILLLFKDIYDGSIFITNKDGKCINSDLIISENFVNHLSNNNEYISLHEESLKDLNGYFYIKKIIKNSDLLGYIVICNSYQIGSNEKFLMKLIYKLIISYL